MGSNLSFILSSMFVVMFCLFGVDLLNVQAIYSQLESYSSNVSYIISKSGATSSVELTNYLTKNELQFTCNFEETPKFGDLVSYTISKKYKPLVLSKNDMFLKVTKETVIGFYE